MTKRKQYEKAVVHGAVINKQTLSCKYYMDKLIKLHDDVVDLAWSG